jgi:carnitine O-acetyltransferase
VASFHRSDTTRISRSGRQAASPIAVEDIEASLRAVLESAEASPSAGPGVGVLTALPRSEWAAAREQLAAIGSNTDTLATIDSALLMVALDADDQAVVGDRCLAGLASKCPQTRSDKWWDKIQVLIDASGRTGVQYEHSFSDGLSWNRWMGETWHAMGMMETPAKWVYGELPAAAAAGATAQVKKLEFALDDALTAEVVRADAFIESGLVANLDLHPEIFEGFGKDAIKKMGHSPDAFVQMAYQLAYARLHDGASAPTYEACSTAGAFHGRTETIRSCSPESVALVAACLDGSTSVETKRELLAAATKAQSGLSRSAAFGEGVDRHMMALAKFAKVRCHCRLSRAPLPPLSRAVLRTTSCVPMHVSWLC